jgi:hypothetical protein
MFQHAKDIHIYITYSKEVNCERDFSLACKLEAKNNIVMYVTIIDVNFSSQVLHLKGCVCTGQFH